MSGRRAPLVLGHRGYSARFPENTLLAFREAFAYGADGVECDLQKTSDGRYVIMHDPAGRMTLAELRELDFGAGERIPLLEDLLASLPGHAYLDLELKAETIGPGDCEIIGEILDARIDRKRLMISSFEPNLLIPFRRHGFTAGLLLGKEAATLGPAAYAGMLMRLRPRFINLPAQSLSVLGPGRARVLFRLLRILGFSLLFWNVGSADQAVVLARYARIIVADEVEPIVHALKG